MYVPRYLFFTKGAGVDKEKLASFENALRNARIAHLNIVTVSSIFPPHCQIIDIEEGLKKVSKLKKELKAKKAEKAKEADTDKKDTKWATKVTYIARLHKQEEVHV